MTRFDDCLKFLLVSEGGYSEHKSDRGGATLDGITQAVYDNWRASKALTLIHVRHMRPQERSSIYKELYWLAGKCDRLPAPLDIAVFDFSVNAGVKQAAKTLQRVLGVEVDGVIGPNTLSALNEDISCSGVDSVAASYMDMRRDFYTKIVERNPSQRVFLNGWLNRCNHLSTFMNLPVIGSEA